MKKFLVLCSSVLLALGLTACNTPKTPADETAPIINGVENKTTTVNETIDLLTGVTAVDETDGDLTSSISVTLMPELTVTDGKVTPDATGSYEIAYKVTDAAGNEGTAYAELNVTPALAEKVEYKNYEFNAAANDIWKLFCWNDDNANANQGTIDVVKGNLQVNVTAHDTEAWHTKFEGNLPTIPGTDYKVTYNFISNVQGKIKTNDWSKEVDVVVGANSVSYSFTAGDGETSYLCLELGMLPSAFIFDFTSINVESSVGQDIYTNVTPTFAYNAEGVSYGAFDNNATGEVTSTANDATINITRGSDENGCWQTKLFVKPGFDLAANVKYKISVDVYSQNGHKFEICYNNGDAEKGIGALYGLELAAGETKTYDIVVKHDTAKDNLVLLFQLGELKTPQGTDVVKVSNLKIEEITGDKTTESKNIVFTPEGFGTFNDAATAAGSLYIENGKLVYEMTKIGLTDWHNKMYIERLELEADKIYTIEFTAKADKNISCAFFLNVLGGWDPRLSATVDFTTTEQVFSYTVSSAFITDMNFELLWQFGSEANQQLGGAKIEFTSIKIFAQDVQ